MDRLRLRHLRLLDAVANTGTLSAAAGLIGMSQPGATKMIQELEEAFGCQLVERTAKGGKLSAAGFHALGRMRIALNALSTARQAIDAGKELPLVRLGILPLVGIDALCHVVRAMQADQKLPRIQIRLGTVESLLKALSDGQVDGVVGGLDDGTAPGNIAGFRVTPLWEESLVIVAAADHPLARRRSLRLDMLRESDWVLTLTGSSVRRGFERLFLQAGLEPPVARIETESFHIGLSLVAASHLLSAVPESAYQQYRTSVKVLSIERVFPSKAVVFITAANLPRVPAVDAIETRFLDYAGSRTALPVRRKTREVSTKS